jgi:hypothetical protein
LVVEVVDYSIVRDLRRLGSPRGLKVRLVVMVELGQDGAAGEAGTHLDLEEGLQENSAEVWGRLVEVAAADHIRTDRVFHDGQAQRQEQHRRTRIIITDFSNVIFTCQPPTRSSLGCLVVLVLRLHVAM